MSLATQLAEILWALGRKAGEFSRKRTPDGEDHYFPRYPASLGLRKFECFFCHKILPALPKHGCHGPTKGMSP